MSKYRRLALVSCTHVGGVGALWPDAHVTVDGQIIRPSPAQRVIGEYWSDFVAKAASADTVCLIGDMVQGNNRKSFGCGTMVADLGEQVRAALSLLSPLCAGKQVLSITGSKYHDSLDTSLDQVICQQLGGRFLGGLKSVKLKGPGKVLNLCHGGASPSMYKASHDDRESMLLDAAIGAGNISHPLDIIVRGHWHYYHHLGLGHRDMIRVPGWQAWYSAKFMLDMLGKKNNKMGAVILDVGPQGCSVKPCLYDPLPLGGEVEEA